jgi:hypothetical protein
MEQHDYRRGGKPNVFFGAEKRYLGAKIGIFTLTRGSWSGRRSRYSFCCSGFSGGSSKCGAPEAVRRQSASRQLG